jgi:S-formylglutathione hydrolase FrmB
MKNIFLVAVLLFILSNATNASVDTINIYSSSMDKNVKAVVITPSKYKKKGQPYPVVYLLHGYGGKYSDWVKRVPGLQQLSDDNQLLIVCPDGNFGSWYFDSPVDSSSRYATNVGVEIPHYIDSMYNTIANRSGRAITGLSMGGHGGLFLGMKHADFFGACGSMSGALDVSQIKQGYSMNKILGDTGINRNYYNDWSVINLLDRFPKDTLAIIIDCGNDDFILQMSRRTHEKMLKLKIAHDYIERPGKHDWPYWRTAVKYQLLFFKEYFSKAKQG